MPAPTPIRRSKELAPLSREHHEGLLFVFKIRQGIKLGIPEARIAQFCAWSLDSHFDLHFKKEEILLAPVLGETHPMMVQMLEEHKTIRKRFAGINENADDAALERLAKSIHDHIRFEEFEERKLFPLIEQTASPEQLTVTGQSLAATSQACEPWTDEFWIKPR
jgi:hypothetical protein